MLRPLLPATWEPIQTASSGAPVQMFTAARALALTRATRLTARISVAVRLACLGEAPGDVIGDEAAREGQDVAVRPRLDEALGGQRPDDVGRGVAGGEPLARADLGD